jgi:hypothetical protein
MDSCGPVTFPLIRHWKYFAEIIVAPGEVFLLVSTNKRSKLEILVSWFMETSNSVVRSDFLMDSLLNDFTFQY